MKFPSAIILLVCCNVFMPALADIVDADVQDLLRTYTFLSSRYGDKSTNDIASCKEWRIDLCKLQNEIEKASSQLGAGLVFTHRMVNIEPYSSPAAKRNWLLEKDTVLFISGSQQNDGGKVIAVLSTRSPVRTWVFTVTPKLEVVVLYDSQAKSSQASYQPSATLMAVDGVEFGSEKSLRFVQRTGRKPTEAQSFVTMALP